MLCRRCVAFSLKPTPGRPIAKPAALSTHRDRELHVWLRHTINDSVPDRADRSGRPKTSVDACDLRKSGLYEPIAGRRVGPAGLISHQGPARIRLSTLKALLCFQGGALPRR